MTAIDVPALVAGERRELAALLAGLPAAAWDGPTLCAGWRVREVVAHMTAPYRHGLPKFLLAMLAARGDVNRAADRLARRDAAALSPEQLTASLRDNAGHPWQPPGGDRLAALSHDVIHGLDITVAQGIERTVPLERVRPILEATTPKALRFFGVDLTGIQLRADDLDWSYGSGAPLCGSAQDLLLVMCGRSLPAGRLRGEPADRFSRC
ncbi:maleylpyruvate isomerase family mycothiol-dependent enzyme [Amycolatopsis suaedae]|uniref:Maleylpyruvate isomerase family mycothiol-dependent enzyme n=1 Tax=Amycolatopsis suaedae TaxID=2510978 RepID=A0A4Q7J4K6_9PSEU|nr:maleylpyruvate isomerase family mycothiol-dependent enzyme [Amycolatopsis suaedae]RZQ62501.1 maleylpyruvate isomerase family mycothiol-dependent enzyme [Amycolatopsis suaedae]